MCSQFFHSSASTDTPTQVSARCRRLRSSGAVNLAAVETHTRITVTMASMMLMHLPSSTLASVFSTCTVCCCCCCSSSFDTRFSSLFVTWFEAAPRPPGASALLYL
ncbi:hypothetical protein EYF80_048682 [Liparis tanakae]|uniref:Uncharacterized protein n=1 Tax=Liparis tanakae TaxID=230148 RepID=A0A4Z2FJ09_9TELE|nr:hypothetical protein EYF80_048682 [Liparis tanakae]